MKRLLYILPFLMLSCKTMAQPPQKEGGIGSVKTEQYQAEFEKKYMSRKAMTHFCTDLRSLMPSIIRAASSYVFDTKTWIEWCQDIKKKYDLREAEFKKRKEIQAVEAQIWSEEGWRKRVASKAVGQDNSGARL